MNSRRGFIDWVNKSGMNESGNIETARFLNIWEKEYAFNSLDRLGNLYPSAQEYIKDFVALEIQRYQVIDNSAINFNDSISEIQAAILFCSKSEKEKQQSLIKISPNLSEYLVTSSFSWNKNGAKEPMSGPSNYFFIPSYLQLAPKELYLIGFNSILLDLMDFPEIFSYKDFLLLVAETLGKDHDKLNQPLMEFVTAQILYYRTFLVVK